MSEILHDLGRKGIVRRVRYSEGERTEGVAPSEEQTRELCNELALYQNYMLAGLLSKERVTTQDQGKISAREIWEGKNGRRVLKDVFWKCGGWL